MQFTTASFAPKKISFFLILKLRSQCFPAFPFYFAKKITFENDATLTWQDEEYFLILNYNTRRLSVCTYRWPVVNDEKSSVCGSYHKVGRGPRVAAPNLVGKVRKDAEWFPGRLAESTSGFTGILTSGPAALVETRRDITTQNRFQLQGLAQFYESILNKN